MANSPNLPEHGPGITIQCRTSRTKNLPSVAYLATNISAGFPLPQSSQGAGLGSTFCNDSGNRTKNVTLVRCRVCYKKNFVQNEISIFPPLFLFPHFLCLIVFLGVSLGPVFTRARSKPSRSSLTEFTPPLPALASRCFPESFAGLSDAPNSCFTFTVSNFFPFILLL